LALVSTILDAHFVTLLLQRQSHALLRRLSSRISAALTLTTDLSTLLGALSIYSRAKKEAHAANFSKKQAGSEKRESKKLGETMEKRVKAQEKHSEVGEYVVDKFYL